MARLLGSTVQPLSHAPQTTRLDSFAKVVGTGALISLYIEIAQLPFFSRVSDANDLLLNTLGVAAGYGIYALVKRIASSRTGSACG